MRLQLQGLRTTYDTAQGPFHAVDGVDLVVPSGRTVGLVGESGSGKSSLARAIMGLTPISAGRLLVDGEDMTPLRRRTTRAFRGRVQLVFQNPYASLNPRMTVRDALCEAIQIHRPGDRSAIAREIAAFLDQVRLPQSAADRYPSDFSGGQRQRIALARALAVRPQLLIADEITSALDVSVQAVILQLIQDIQAQSGIGILFITHNLNVVRWIADHVAVMNLGRIVEQGPTEAVFGDPQHPYTRVLTSSMPVLGQPLLATPDLGEAADPLRPPPGCRFHTRCPEGPRLHPERTVCAERDPQAIAPSRAHDAACHFAPRSSSVAAIDAA